VNSDDMTKPIRIALITTAPEAIISFLGEQIRLLAARGYEVHTISSPGLERFPGHENLESHHHETTMRRPMRPVADVLSLYRLWLLLRQIRPDLVQTHTPKAGLLGMIAASVAGVPIRIYTVNGLPMRVQPLWGRLVLAVTERLACALATEVLCVSRSARRVLIGTGLCASSKCRVLGDGGSHGVDILKFSSDSHGAASRSAIRMRYVIPEDALVLGYIGRIVPAKGINELALAWAMLREVFPQLRLLLCGYAEPDHPIDPILLERLRSDPRVHFTSGRVADMPPIFAALDINVLPTYCEGLPNVVLEASAMNVPTVATRVPGCVDTIRDGITGLLVKPKDPEALAVALRYLVENPKCRERMGIAARKFVSRRYPEDRISGLLMQRYQDLLQGVRGDSSKTALIADEIPMVVGAARSSPPEASTGGMVSNAHN
jgi:glycosyltransferase involved in cell wall biosynthesis